MTVKRLSTMNTQRFERQRDNATPGTCEELTAPRRRRIVPPWTST
jgi:hypothetical protein